jgi:hypothetical protein
MGRVLAGMEEKCFVKGFFWKKEFLWGEEQKSRIKNGGV